MKTLTITIQIGNSDDKLTQKEWSEYVEKFQYIINRFTNEIYFFGGATNWSEWQNACWVIGMPYESEGMSEYHLDSLKESLTSVRKRYRQDSFAWTEGTTLFV